MLEYNTLENCILVDCSAYGFGPFSVLILPEPHEKENTFSFYLRHPQYGDMKYMFTCDTYDKKDAAELGYRNAAEYIPDFILDLFPDDEIAKYLPDTE